MVDKNYRMSKPLKTMLFTMHDPVQRTEYKKLFMEAENHSVIMRRKMSIKVIDVEGDE